MNESQLKKEVESNFGSAKNRSFNVYHEFETIMLIFKNIVIKIVVNYKAGFKH